MYKIVSIRLSGPIVKPYTGGVVYMTDPQVTLDRFVCERGVIQESKSDLVMRLDTIKREISYKLDEMITLSQKVQMGKAIKSRILATAFESLVEEKIFNSESIQLIQFLVDDDELLLVNVGADTFEFNVWEYVEKRQQKGEFLTISFGDDSNGRSIYQSPIRGEIKDISPQDSPIFKMLKNMSLDK